MSTRHSPPATSLPTIDPANIGEVAAPESPPATIADPIKDRMIQLCSATD